MNVLLMFVCLPLSWASLPLGIFGHYSFWTRSISLNFLWSSLWETCDFSPGPLAGPLSCKCYWIVVKRCMLGITFVFTKLILEHAFYSTAVPGDSGIRPSLLLIANFRSPSSRKSPSFAVHVVRLTAHVPHDNHLLTSGWSHRLSHGLLSFSLAFLPYYF